MLINREKTVVVKEQAKIRTRDELEALLEPCFSGYWPRTERLVFDAIIENNLVPEQVDTALAAARLKALRTVIDKALEVLS